MGNLLAIVFGTVAGLFFGVIPGLGAVVGIAMLLPLTYTMEPLQSILMLVALYQAAEYGGSISGIVLGVPGTAAAVATALDGNAMAKKGFPGKALGFSLTASTIGGLIGAIILMSLTVPLSTITYNFADPEYFLLGLLGLVCIASLGSENMFKSFISVLLGLLLSTVGIDSFTGLERFTFGNVNLMEGVTMIALLVGLFAISEVMSMLQDDLNKRYVTDTKRTKVAITWKEFQYVRRNIFKGSILGAIIGIIPGLGASAAAWLTYTEAKRTSKTPETFGKGEPNGIATPESANNAAVGGALVPLLTLGIPGSAATAVILGAFMIHGIQPGPLVFKEDPNLINGIFWGFFIAAIMMYIFGKYTTSLWARLLTIPNYILIPIVLFVSLIGSFVARANTFDVWLALIVGIIAFLMKKLDFSLPALVLAFILGPLIEEGLRRSLMLSSGSYSIFFTRGYSLVILSLIILVLGSTIYRKLKSKSIVQNV